MTYVFLRPMMEAMVHARTLGERIKRARERLRMTQQQLADAIGVTQKTIDNWEHDRTIPKSAIGALEHVLGVSLTGEHEELPAVIEQNQDDPRVIEIMNMKEITFASKLAVIRLILAEDDGGEADRRPG